MNLELFDKVNPFDQENIQLLSKLFKRSDKGPVALDVNQPVAFS